MVDRSERGVPVHGSGARLQGSRLYGQVEPGSPPRLVRLHILVLYTAAVEASLVTGHPWDRSLKCPVQ